MLNTAWIDKLCIGLERKRHHPARHAPLKEQLAVNRGRAIGLPKRYPSAWLENRIRARFQAKTLRIVASGGCPF